MGVSIIKTDMRGAYRLVAECDLYLDETRQRIIVVKEGDAVPKDAAFVLTGKGGTIPTQYADMLKALDAPPAPEVKAAPEPVLQPILEPPPLPPPKPKAVKPKPVEEKPAA